MFKRKQVLNCIWILAIVMLLAGCSYNANNSEATSDNEATGFLPATPGNYDSADTAVIVKIDRDALKIQFMTLADGRYYTLNYDGATCFYDKYGQALTEMQISEGDMVDINFMKTRKRLDTLRTAEGIFSISGIDDFEITGAGYRMKVAGQDYTFSDDLVVITETGKGELIDLNQVDTIRIQGYDHKICSILVEQGHGYLKLEGESFFVGGWLEVTDKMIYEVSPEMLVTVPSGILNVSITNDGCVGSETISIAPGQEYVWNVEKWQGEVKSGSILFTVSPTDARVYIDGEKQDIAGPIELTYGIHQMIVMKSGYQTVSRYIKVGSESATISVELEEKTEDSVSEDKADTLSENGTGVTVTEEKDGSDTKKESEKENSEKEDGSDDSGNSESRKPTSDTDITVASSKPQVYINSPVDTEVYVDGLYTGLAPVSFTKKEGTVVITLRKQGYQTKSYTLELDGADEDVNYSFSELIEE